VWGAGKGFYPLYITRVSIHGSAPHCKLPKPTESSPLRFGGTAQEGEQGNLRFKIWRRAVMR
jgi:hypothetical protein